MSTREASFKKLSQQAVLEEAFEILKAIDLQIVPENNREDFLRPLKVLPLLVRFFQKIDADFFHLNTFTSINNWVISLRDNARSYAQNKNFGHINNVNSNIDEILNFVKPFVSLFENDDVAALKDSLGVAGDLLRADIKKMSEVVSAMKVEIDGLSVTSKNISVDFDKQKSRLDQVISEFQRQSLDGQQNRVKEFGAELSGIKKQFATEVKNFHEESLNIFKNQKEEFSGEKDKNKKEVNELLADMKSSEEQARKIMNVIGNVGLTGDFKKSADDEAGQANLFRRIALILMLVSAGMALWAFIESLSDPDWKVFLMRMAASFFIFAPALYASKESGRHRDLERYNRKQQLELSSIDAYLALLPSDERDRLKADLTNKFFGQKDPADIGAQLTTATLLGILKGAVDNLTKNIGKK